MLKLCYNLFNLSFFDETRPAYQQDKYCTKNQVFHSSVNVTKSAVPGPSLSDNPVNFVMSLIFNLLILNFQEEKKWWLIGDT